MPTTDISAILEFRTHLRQCSDCELHKVGKGPVPWSGDPDCEFAVMAEAPGRTEDHEGRPLVGDTGAILRHWLKQTGFDASKMAMLNTVSCYPAGTPSPEHIKACRGWMNGQLEVIRPKLLITLGVIAYSAIRNNERFPPLKVMHGKPYRHPVYNFAVISTYHPAAYLRGRNRHYEDKIVDDLRAAREWWDRYSNGEPWPASECYVCGDEFHNWDEFCVPLCYRHSMKAGVLFPEDE